VHRYLITNFVLLELTRCPLRPSPMFMGLIRAAMKFAELGKSQPQPV
jgi:hypothetical protein